ncbi:hypothetical protein L1987_20507 [Smallanthus sonchifolius]|uniref:Uncharacterized protein n=1 Tax=Smallanthus sonchifolius TaxID=185202 RepID=A0ACB9IS74_9ASTR|nr:hypothetical protein L1987_20507 [Smallanthus sonchifolius]
MVELKKSIYRSVDEVMQLPDSDLQRMMELGEAHEPENDSERHLLLVIKHHFNPSKDVVIDVKPLQSYYPFVNCCGLHNFAVDLQVVADKASQQHQTFDAADRQIISSFDFATNTSAVTLTHLSA